MKLKKGDKVVVIAGKDKGQSGIITKVINEKNQVVVEGVNVKTYHRKPTQVNPEGGIIKQEGPINVSNVMYAEGNKKGPSTVSKIGYRFEKNAKSGKVEKIRYMKKNNQDI